MGQLLCRLGALLYGIAAWLQVQHRKVAGARWELQLAGGLFSKAQALVVEAERDFSEGEVVTMDFGASLSGEDEGKLDSQVLLDYGALDADRVQVGPLLICQWEPCGLVIKRLC